MTTPSPWPGNAPFALCLTHDVDHVKRHLYQRLWKMAHGGLRTVPREIGDLAASLGGRNSAWNFERLMRLEDDYGARSTFLFMHESAKGFGPRYWGRYSLKNPAVRHIIREIDAAGWEVGLHGSLYSHVRPGLLESEKRLLEDILQKEVRSTRQHYLNVRQGVTFRIQEQAGLKVDSSLGFSHIPYDGSMGYLPFFAEGTSVLELPITVMDTIGLGAPQVRRNAEAAVKAAAGAGGVVMLDWHQCAFDANLFPERIAFYRDTLEFARSRGAWIATMEQIASHWTATEARRNDRNPQ